MLKRKKKKIYKRPATGLAPLTSERQLSEAIKKRNAENRSRSKAMENRVAKVLNGRRIPMSGAAAAFKGDVEVLFDNYPGKYIVECKLSGQKQRQTDQPIIRLDYKWFPKIQQEAKNMNARFGVLVLHYMDHGNDYVFIRREIIDLLMTRYESPYTNILQQMISVNDILDIRFKVNTTIVKSGHDLTRKVLETRMTDIQGYKSLRLLLPDGEYLIIHLSTFKAFTEHM